jgi:polygalacturonase
MDVRRSVWLLLLTAALLAGIAARATAQSCSAGSAIQSQLSALAATGGKVSLPCGWWTLTQTLVMPSHTALEGEGACTVLYAPAAGTTIVGDYNARRYGLAVRELMIDGRAPGATQDGYIGQH